MNEPMNERMRERSAGSSEWCLVSEWRCCSLLRSFVVVSSLLLLRCLVSLLLLGAGGVTAAEFGVSLIVSRVLVHHISLICGLVVVRELICRRMEGDTLLDRDERIMLSIGAKEHGNADGQFNTPSGLVFDHHRGLLLVSDSINHRVQVFSCDDGFSFVSKFGKEGGQAGQFVGPWGLAIDHDHDRILVVDRFNHRLQSWSLREQSFLSCIGKYGSRALEFNNPRGIAMHHHRIIIADTNHRLVFLSLVDLSFLFSIGKQGNRPGEFSYPSSIAIDHDRHRIIVTDSYNHRVQVLSLIDGSFLFQFGSKGEQAGQFTYPEGSCIDNQGRIIVADALNRRLQAFTHEGHHISSFDCGTEKPFKAAFDEHRGLIAFSTSTRVHVIGANQWLADTFTWLPDRHLYAPSWMKQTISTMTMIRSLVNESAMSMIPNELLFEIFSMLEPPDRITCNRAQKAKKCTMV